MKKLNLVSPNERFAFLNRGKGKQVKYIQLSEELDADALKEDIQNGAVQFRQVEELANKKQTSRFVMINVSDYEDGLKAVSYLAGIYNHRDNAYDGDVDFNELDESESSQNELYDLIGQVNKAESDDVEENDKWVESPVRIPIITSGEIVNYNYGFDDLPNGNLQYFLASKKAADDVPYWVSCREQPVIIVYSITDSCLGDIGLTDCTERFTHNRHVYIIIVHNKTMIDNKGRLNGFEELKEIMLDNTAAVVNINAMETEMRKYYCTIFENLVAAQGALLEEKFDVENTVNSIISSKQFAKINFLDKTIKYVLFNVRNERSSNEYSSLTLTGEDFEMLDRLQFLNEKPSNYESAYNRLQKLVGMEPIKGKVFDAVNVLKFNKYREHEGLGSSDYHSVYAFVGAAGTAKTTIAQLMGDIMREEKILSNNRFISISGTQLKGEYVGHTAPKIAEIFRKYDIIFIDEAYSLTSTNNGDTDSYAQEALAQLAVELENHGRDRLVIFAGYGGSDVSAKDNKMRQFIDTNPGIRSRISEIIYFPSYTVQEMVDITQNIAEGMKFKIDATAIDSIREYFSSRVTDRGFGNGREARRLVENAMKHAASRYYASKDPAKTAVEKLEVSDIETAIRSNIEGNTQLNGRKRKECGFAIVGEKNEI